MAEIVNLKRARKTRERALKEAKAAENRVHFGTPKSLIKLAKARTAKETRDHETRRLTSEKDGQN